MDKQSQNIRDFLKIHKTLLWLSSFFILGALIRIYKLGDHNLWYDEFRSFLISNTFDWLRTDYHPPFYFVLLSIWVRFFGSNEFSLRSLSMIFGLFSLPLIYILGKLLFDTKTGLISAFIISISPIYIWYSQEARGYSLSVFLVMLTAYFFMLSIKKNKVYLWSGFIISSTLALYTNYFSFFIIILLSILFLSRSNRSLLKHYLVSLCLITVSLLPVLPLLFKQMSSIENILWMPKPKLMSIAITFKNFNVGYNATERIYSFSFIIFSLLFILGIWFCWQEKRKELLLLILLLFTPIIFTFLISQRTSIYLDRQLMLFSPFYYIIIATGLSKINLQIIKSIAYLSIIIPILICLNNYYSYRITMPFSYHIGVHVKKPVKPAADYINSHFREDDLVAYSDWSAQSVFYYLRNFPKKQRAYFFIESQLKYVKYLYKQLEEHMKSYQQKSRSWNAVNLETTSNIPGASNISQLDFKSWNAVNLETTSNIPGASNISQLDFKRVWLISTSWAKDGRLNPHVKAVRQFMRDHYSLLDSIESYGIFVDLYCNKNDFVLR